MRLSLCLRRTLSDVPSIPLAAQLFSSGPCGPQCYKHVKGEGGRASSVRAPTLTAVESVLLTKIMDMCDVYRSSGTGAAGRPASSLGSSAPARDAGTASGTPQQSIPPDSMLCAAARVLGTRPCVEVWAIFMQRQLQFGDGCERAGDGFDAVDGSASGSAAVGEVDEAAVQVCTAMLSTVMMNGCFTRHDVTRCDLYSCH